MNKLSTTLISGCTRTRNMLMYIKVNLFTGHEVVNVFLLTQEVLFTPQ